MLHLDLLTQELNEVKQKWYDIGWEFNLPDSVLKSIRCMNSNNGIYLREMFRARLQRRILTWRDIVTALRSPRIKEFQRADQLEAKYCPSKFITNRTNRPYPSVILVHFAICIIMYDVNNPRCLILDQL